MATGRPLDAGSEKNARLRAASVGRSISVAAPSGPKAFAWSVRCSYRLLSAHRGFDRRCRPTDGGGGAKRVLLARAANTAAHDAPPTSSRGASSSCPAVTAASPRSVRRSARRAPLG
jgi:hypothetical protein